jgi:hypothetical protein
VSRRDAYRRYRSGVRIDRYARQGGPGEAIQAFGNDLMEKGALAETTAQAHEQGFAAGAARVAQGNLTFAGKPHYDMTQIWNNRIWLAAAEMV